ncbi:MAG: hypothetical protein L0228_19035 [Planctomycetes bacterium]|nr:hypothetical protein [Planctomycetota bacterium]
MDRLFSCLNAALQRHAQHVLLAVLSVAILGSAAPRVHATNLSWDANGAFPPDGTFNVLGNWNDNTQFPTAGDTAIFNINNTYTVTFDANAASDVLVVGTGTVNFRSDSATIRTYNLTGLSHMHVNNGGTLNIGSASLPVIVNVEGALGRLFVGDAGSGTVTVDGAGSALHVSGADVHFLGDGHTGTLTFSNASLGSISSLAVGSVPIAGTTGNLNVLSNADLTVADLLIGTNVSTATGTVTVADSGSTLTVTGVGVLQIGGSATGNFGVLNVNSGGTFSSGTGNVDINPGGDINIGGGTLNLNGNTTVDGGSITRTSGNLNLAAGKTLTAQNNAQINLGSSFDLSQGTIWNQ